MGRLDPSECVRSHFGAASNT
ncbi:Protein of unknown function [Propionibacterium freudenreichii]|nr:Protein of unknown function [Propionibacterium freudenreichii]CEI50070.1 Protein of unknown function [Propionibacterium freudenreichii]